MITAIDRSFKTDGGLGGFMGYPDDKKDDNGYFLIRFFFDNVYFIILMIIMINIVAGIIIDTFGSLREELLNYTFDLGNYCFICGFDAETIDKNSEGKGGFKYRSVN